MKSAIALTNPKYQLTGELLTLKEERGIIS
jgi:hypothetical protein